MANRHILRKMGDCCRVPGLNCESKTPQQSSSCFITSRKELGKKLDKKLDKKFDKNDKKLGGNSKVTGNKLASNSEETPAAATCETPCGGGLPETVNAVSKVFLTVRC